MSNKYYTDEDILRYIGLDHEFRQGAEYPFNRNMEDVSFGISQIAIPRAGIEKTVQNKISDISDQDPIKEITMLLQLVYKHDAGEGDLRCGVVNKNISLSFRYDKQYKYGDISKSIFEVCYYIITHAQKMNDFYIINQYIINDFLSEYVFNNQWGLGSVECTGTRDMLHVTRHVPKPDPSVLALANEDRKGEDDVQSV